ncbi:Glutamyl-tRNA amidotransferase B subunit [Earliella scabrosa]|nr:Glutamyl-tRNA amidotransferase B subunit [Earliella scabrosa]
MLAHGRTRLLTRNIRWARQAHTTRAHKEDARWPGWQVVVGIEVHAQIKSRQKLFSEAPWSDLTSSPNTHVVPFDAAFPGTLPRLNPKCVELGVRTALALNAEVQHRSAFDRKHYFYADLPSGYQITQQYAPIARNGRLQLDDLSVGIKQIQLEQSRHAYIIQDTGKSTFMPRNRVTAIDLNRAGMGLMEIVSEPDMRSPEEAGSYVRTLQALLRSVGSSDGNMEQGSLRCDVNVSVNRIGETPGTRCEIKNLNSVKFMMVAITCEVFRQIALIESGARVAQETRGFNEEKAETYSLRSKEDAPDYRYMPDPNIPPLLIDSSYVDAIRLRMPPLPDATRARLLEQGLSQRDVEVLMDVDSGREVGFDGELGHGAVAYFDEVSRGRDPKVVVNWITHELLGQLAYRNETFKENPMSIQQMGDLIDLVQAGKVTGTSGKTILRHILTTRTSELPSTIAEELKLLAASDDGASLEKWCREAIAALPEEAEVVRRGNLKVVNKIMGHVMKASRGTAKAQDARELLLKLLQ